MKKWYYLKSTFGGFDDIKAAALASVISKSEKTYNIVHTSIVSRYLKGLDNVEVGYPVVKDGDTISVLDLPDNAPFEIICKKASEQLGVCCDSTIEPYLGFAQGENEVDKTIERMGNVVLFCYYYSEGTTLSIMPKIEKAIDIIHEESLCAVCCGSIQEEKLKHAYDLRGLVGIEEVVRKRHRIKAIVTTLPLVRDIGMLLHIPVVFLYSNVFVVYNEEETSVIDSTCDYSQELANYLMGFSNGILPKCSPNNSTEIVSKKFEVPYNFDELLLDYYHERLSFVNYLYLPPYAKDTFNSRTCLQSKINGFSYMPQTREEYEYHLQLIRNKGLRFIVLWQDSSNVISRKMLDYYFRLGASGFIIANDANAKIIKEYNPSLLVIASIVQRLCTDINKKDFRYYDYVVLFYPFMRALNAIKKLAGIKEKIILMANSRCHTDCQGVQHWFIKDISKFDKLKMCHAYYDGIKNTTLIHPEHLHLFDDYVGGYKIQGREWDTDHIISNCEAYFNRTLLTDFTLPQMINDIEEQMKGKTLEEYYNLKTSEIIDSV